MTRKALEDQVLDIILKGKRGDLDKDEYIFGKEDCVYKSLLRSGKSILDAAKELCDNVERLGLLEVER